MLYRCTYLTASLRSGSESTHTWTEMEWMSVRERQSEKHSVGKGKTLHRKWNMKSVRVCATAETLTGLRSLNALYRISQNETNDVYSRRIVLWIWFPCCCCWLCAFVDIAVSFFSLSLSLCAVYVNTYTDSQNRCEVQFRIACLHTNELLSQRKKRRRQTECLLVFALSCDHCLTLLLIWLGWTLHTK